MAFVIPGAAIKIAPYANPLHDIMYWNAASAKLIIQNPEGESLTTSWPSTVDLWNYNGTSWTFDLPTGDKFAFSKRVDVNVSTTEGAGSTIRGISVTDTVGAALGIHEAIRGIITSSYMTGGWANAIQGTITYSATGSAGGGMAAPICSEMNMQPAASSGGSYYTYHSYFNFPTSTVLIDSTDYNYAFELYEAAGGAVSCFDDYGEFIRIVGLTDATTHIWYDNTLRIHIGTTDWFIPLSEAEGMYYSSYPVLALPETTDSTTAMIGRTTVAGGVTVTNTTANIRGIVGYVDMAGTANGDNIFIAGIHAQLVGAGTWTEVSRAFALCADSQVSVAVTAGETALLGLVNNGTTKLGSAIYFDGNHSEGDAKDFENVFTFDRMNWPASNSSIQNGGTGDKTIDTGGMWKKIRIDIDGTQFYLIAMIDPDES